MRDAVELGQGDGLHVNSTDEQDKSSDQGNGTASKADFSFAMLERSHPSGLVYIKSATGRGYLHTHGGTKEGHSITLHNCPRHERHDNCIFRFKASFDGHLYLKSSDQEQYVHTHGGNHYGAVATLNRCSVWWNAANCQWALEPSPTKKGYFYIRSKKTHLYLHVEWWGGLTLQLCPKWRNHLGCQWKIEPYCMDTRTQCNHWKKQGECSRSGKYYCMKTCGFCDSTTPKGRWELVRGVYGGDVEEQITTSVTNSKEVSVSKSVAYEITATGRMSMEFAGVGGSVELSMTAREEITNTVTDGISKHFGQTSTVKCRHSSPHKKTWLYQWVIEAEGFKVKTSHSECSYIQGSQHWEPQCPLGFCSKGTHDCKASDCRPFKA